MNTPGPQGPSRALGDYQVDRAQVYGGQPLQPSATNRPCSLISSNFLANHPTLQLPFCQEAAKSEWRVGNNLPYSLLATRSLLTNWLSTSARGPHPFPFRTRSLSPAAPMVLRPRGRGRVGRRQPIPSKPALLARAGFFFLLAAGHRIAWLPAHTNPLDPPSPRPSREATLSSSLARAMLPPVRQ